jgi:hypothetical protein
MRITRRLHGVDCATDCSSACFNADREFSTRSSIDEPPNPSALLPLLPEGWFTINHVYVGRRSYYRSCYLS